MTVVALYVIDEDGEATGEVYHFCSPLCRSYMTRELAALYRSEGQEVRTGRADLAGLAPDSICETCGKILA